MSCLMGIDLGTQSVRAMIIDEDGRLLSLAGESYDVSIPKPGFAEQDPDIWYAKTVQAIRRALAASGRAGDDISAVSFSGQMHGIVTVDRDGCPLRPAIIWLDQRASDSIKHIYKIAGADFVAQQVQNTISTGFMLGSLFWIYENDRGCYDKIFKVMFPKDYIKYRLCGRIITDYSDAAGGTAFDNIRLCWAVPLINKLGLRTDIFPECLPSAETVGTINALAAGQTGLSVHTKVVNGGSDQCMQCIGNAIVNEGDFACNIGTGGQISTVSAQPIFDSGLRTNTFAHVLPGRWSVMGASLNSGASLKWLSRSVIGISDYAAVDNEAKKLPPGSRGLIFLPYLTGDRTPHLDPEARGMFCGLTMTHDRYHMARSVMEGVTYSLKDSMNLLLDMGLSCKRIIASGGGANSRLWLQMQADILEQNVYKSLMTEQASLGAAITAGVATGAFGGFGEACERIVHMDTEVFHPIERNVKIYREYYPLYRELYSANKYIFSELNRISGEAENFEQNHEISF